VLRGIQQIVSQLDAKANLQGIDEVLGAMTQSSFALQEGCATLVELLFRTTSQEPEALERRMKGLPLHYYLSVQYYEPLFTGVIQAFADPRYASHPGDFIHLMICALASSCLAVDILDEFAIYSQISPATVTTYLSVSDHNPDERLVKLTRCFREGLASLPSLLEPALATLNILVDDPAKVQGLEQKTNHRVRVRWELQSAVNECVRKLRLFPVRNLSPLDISAAKIKIMHSAFGHYGLNVSEDANLEPHLNEEQFWQMRSFNDATERWDFDQRSRLEQLPNWISETKKANNCFAGVFVPVPSERSIEAGQQSRYVLEMVGLNLAVKGEQKYPTLAFDRRAIQLHDLDLRALADACDQFTGSETAVVTTASAWTWLADHSQDVRRVVTVPLCVYSREISARRFRYLVTGGSERLRGTILRHLPFADAVLRLDVEEEHGRPFFYLFFLSNALMNVYSALAEELSVPMEDRSADFERREDRILGLACWACTMGTIGAMSDNT
jgi:hypothetical protein